MDQACWGHGAHGWCSARNMGCVLQRATGRSSPNFAAWSWLLTSQRSHAWNFPSCKNIFSVFPEKKNEDESRANCSTYKLAAEVRLPACYRVGACCGPFYLGYKLDIRWKWSIYVWLVTVARILFHKLLYTIEGEVIPDMEQSCNRGLLHLSPLYPLGKKPLCSLRAPIFVCGQAKWLKGK